MQPELDRKTIYTSLHAKSYLACVPPIKHIN